MYVLHSVKIILSHKRFFVLTMRGSRKFCQRGSNFDNNFLFVI